MTTTTGHRLIFQRHNRPLPLAVSGDTLQAAAGLWDQPHRTIAINRVSILSEIPTATLSRTLCSVINRRARGWQYMGAGEGERQQQCGKHYYRVRTGDTILINA